MQWIMECRRGCRMITPIYHRHFRIATNKINPPTAIKSVLLSIPWMIGGPEIMEEEGPGCIVGEGGGLFTGALDGGDDTGVVGVRWGAGAVEAVCRFFNSSCTAF